ncbi:DeoR/GlpR family DNA-binding transcription regulator [Lysinibacter sp. HNR]|uniref:DeoR/GlpR family DNA-binding transcription regulator n=1 Tax=Lysinibacter sp. HNR TaxID=3031408 RepID=UPI002434DCB4|nr:DeoR/GlpR family DNA-binding transcription regulator [Lysinibacter sp. HNR]WGD37756.1 DeoR/GlpR family DNA-binding transcription regulator [Lysinibacter sp. HNR]
MFAEERQSRIAEMVTANGRVTVTELAARFDITAETVRRDLDVLEAARQLRRVHGGAVTLDRLSMAEPSLDERLTQRYDEKRRIAAVAQTLVPSGKTASVILDAGSSTELLAHLLAQWTPVTPGDELLVITNAVPIVAQLSAHPELQLHVLGGRVRGLTRAIVGSVTEQQLASLRPDIAFIGTNGIDSQFGLSTPDPVEAAVKTAIVKSARRTVVLADSSKLGKAALVKFADLGEIDTLITDAAPAGSLSGALITADVEVVVA